VERHISKPYEWGSGGAIAPDLPERIDGCRESEVSCEWWNGDTFCWPEFRSMRVKARAWGMQRGRAASPLAKWFCTTKHILQSAFRF